VNEDEKFHVVVGASGGSGSALVRELTGRNRQVRVVNRSGRATVPPGVEVVAADATSRTECGRCAVAPRWSTTWIDDHARLALHGSARPTTPAPAGRSNGSSRR